MYVALMIRTQIYLDERLQQALRTRSAAEGRSVAALIREAVAHFLMPPTKGKASDPFLAIAGKHAGGPGDSAERHDTYTYRRKRK
jgi:plasmid stability protein